jgi:hypothetical protein
MCTFIVYSKTKISMAPTTATVFDILFPERTVEILRLQNVPRLRKSFVEFVQLFIYNARLRGLSMSSRSTF